MPQTSEIKVVVIKGPHYDQALKNAYATMNRIIRKKLNEDPEFYRKVVSS